MRYLLAVLLVTINLQALQTSERLFECTKVFEERKSELLLELERIDEQKQALDALKTATDELITKRQNALAEQEAKNSELLQQIDVKEKKIEAMLEENKKVLEEIKALKMDKVTRTFAKMKPAASAKILGDMSNDEAAKILSTLKPATAGKILAKMDSKKASEITLLLSSEKE
jgi:flagellar motility protein MotE (MotC chaperone)